jgi:DNA-binding LacI/PurR family transcriptional regulator
MPPSRKPTIKDVASYAGVSIKTVSNVINDWPYLTPETRLKVQKAIAEVGYRRNNTARSLVTGKTNTIGVIIPDIANPFFGAAIRGCEDILYETEYSLFLCNTNEDVKRERYNINLLVDRGVDALILWGTRLSSTELNSILGSDLPLVTVEFDEAPCRQNHTCINIDNTHGAMIATQHLIEQGYKNIAHMAGPFGRVTSQRRVQGYQQALQAADIPFNPEWVVNVNPTTSGGYQAARKFLKSSRPEAFFCYNDLIALGVSIAAREFDLEIPKDLAIVGFDDINLASIFSPPLTTIRISQYDLGKLTGQATLDLLLHKEQQPITIQFPVELIVRGSSGKSSLTTEDQNAIWKSLVS